MYDNGIQAAVIRTKLENPLNKIIYIVQNNHKRNKNTNSGKKKGERQRKKQ